MNDSRKLPVSSLSGRGKHSAETRRSLKETLLIVAWVVGYAGVLFAFRVSKLFERSVTNKQEKSAGA